MEGHQSGLTAMAGEEEVQVIIPAEEKSEKGACDDAFTLPSLCRVERALTFWRTPWPNLAFLSIVRGAGLIPCALFWLPRRNNILACNLQICFLGLAHPALRSALVSHAEHVVIRVVACGDFTDRASWVSFSALIWSIFDTFERHCCVVLVVGEECLTRSGGSVFLEYSPSPGFSFFLFFPALVEMQSLNTSISRGKPFSSRKEMPRGGGLPLCLSGVCILAQVPQKNKTTLRSISARSRSSSSSVSSLPRNFVVRAALDLSAAESRNLACDSEARSCQDSTNIQRPNEASVYLPSEADVHRLNDANDHRSTEANDHRPNEANVHQPRLAVAQEMAKLDRRRESLKKRRSVQGLGSFLGEQTFMLSRVPREFIRSWWLEMVYAELYSSNPRLGHCSARAA